MNDMTKPPEKPTNFPAMLKIWLPEIQRALPKHMNPERMSRIALTAFRQTPKLAECDPLTVFAAVVQSAQLGLEVGLMGEAHLVPFNGKCQLIPGYQGLMKLARNSGLVEDIYAHEVRANDDFEMTLGLQRTLTHRPKMDGGFPASDETRGDIVGFYAVAVFKDGTRSFVAMSRHEVDHIRDNSKGYQAAKKYKKESPWDTDYVAMGVKTVIRRLCKFMPKSPELAQALALDDTAARGKDQGINLTDAIEGNWTPAPDAEEPKDEALPPYEATAFKKNLKGWLKMIADGKKTAADVIAMLSTKNTLTPAQMAVLRGGAPATDEAMNLLRAKAEVAAITDVEIANFLDVDQLTGLSAEQVDMALAFVANPGGDQ